MKTEDWPESRGRRNHQLEGFIRQCLASGRMNDEQITDEVERAYNTLGEPVPWLDIDVTLFAMTSGRQVKRAEGKWEGEYFYELIQKPTATVEQPALFS